MGATAITPSTAKHHIERAMSSSKGTPVTSREPTRLGMETEAGASQYAAHQKMYGTLIKGGYEVILDTQLGGLVNTHIAFVGDNLLLKRERSPQHGNKPKPQAQKPGTGPLQMGETVRVKGRIIHAICTGRTDVTVFAIGESIERIN
jgi:hypothetical protein